MNYTTKTIEVPQTTQEIINKVYCDNCSLELEPLSCSMEEDPFNYSFNDALNIKLDGGYGAYIDGGMVPAEDKKFIFCKNCADLLLEKFPCFKNIKED